MISRRVVGGGRQAAALFGDEALEVGAEAQADLGVHLVVPLQEPGQELVEAVEEGGEALVRPGLAVAGFEVAGGESQATIVPTGSCRSAQSQEHTARLRKEE